LDQNPLGVNLVSCSRRSAAPRPQAAPFGAYLQLGFAVEAVDRFGTVSKTYEPGRVEGLPALDVAGSNLQHVKLRVVSLRS
jgi:hypothetical protein